MTSILRFRSRRRHGATRRAGRQRCALAPSLALLLVACGAGDGTTPTQTSPTPTVSVSPAAVSCQVGEQVTLRATLSPVVTGASFSFTPSSGAVSVSGDGATATVRCVTAGTAVVTVGAAGQSITVPVTVAAPSVLVQAISGAPDSLTLAVAGTAQLSALATLAAGAPAGTPTTVSYASSDTSVVTVSGAGLVTARRAGPATITVAAVGAPAVTRQIRVVVTGAGSALVVIQSLRTSTGPGGALQPADTARVRATLAAQVLVGPDGAQLDSVQAQLGRLVQTCERYVPARTAAAIVTCAVNTARFDTVTGVPQIENGPRVLTVRAFYRAAGAAPGAGTQVGADQRTVSIDNPSGFYARITHVPSADQVAHGAPPNGEVTTADGRTFRAGAFRVQLTPVIYDSVAPNFTSVRVSLGRASVFAQRVGTDLIAVIPGTTARAPDPSGATLDGYTSPAEGDALRVNASGGNVTPPAILSVTGAPTTPTLFIDNQTPEPPARFTLPGDYFRTTGGQVSGLLPLNLDLAAAFQPVYASGNATNTDFGGSGGVALTRFVGAASLTTPQIIANAVLATSTSALALNASRTAYRLVYRYVDVLGNELDQDVVAPDADGVSRTVTFGVTLDPPAARAGVP